MWKIVSSSEGVSAGDYRVWLHEIETERGGLHTVEARVTGSAWVSADSGLPGVVAAAKQSRGRTAVEAVLSWARPPRLITVTTDWITIHHRNGYFSRVGWRLPDDPTQRFEALVDRAKIRVPFGQGVEHVYEYREQGRWVLRALQSGDARLEEPRMLADVVSKLSGDRLQEALDLDPEGASELAMKQLDESESRVLRGLLSECEDNTVEDIRIRLTRGTELPYEGVEQVLERLWIRGYVEEFSPGRWKATANALVIQDRLLGLSAAA
jgi:hypothetical protein